MKNINRVAIVTGGARGIGLGISQKLYEDGYRVAVLDCGEAAPKEIGLDMDRVHIEQIDVTSNEDTQHAINRITERWGHVDILVNNAGISPKNEQGVAAGVLDVSDEEWASVFSVNLTAALKLSQMVIPGMAQAGWGRIVNISSQSARTRAIVPGIAYVASKSAVLGLTRVIANEFGPSGITTNSITPGRIVSGMSAQVSNEVNDEFVEITPVRRLGFPCDVAAAVTFVVSDEARFINGAIIDVNGGLYMP